MEVGHNSKKSKRWFQQTGWVVASLILFWPVGLFLMWKYTNWSKWVKAVVSVAEVALFGVIVTNIPPSIKIDDFSNGRVTTDNSSYKITGTATYADAVTINDKRASYNGNVFSATIDLKQGDNAVRVVATKGDKRTEEHYTIHRTTDAEIKAKKDAQAALDAQKVKEEADVKAAADAAAEAKQEAAAKAKAEAAVTVSQKNALSKAKSYISYTAFSHDGLVEQLEYDQFSTADATYGADNCGADWNEQAAEKAKSYMSYSSFSRGSLIDQLEYDKFTPDQAAHGADSVGL